jgi:acetylglutamate kinase
MKELYIIKIGGNIIDDAPALDKFLYDLSKLKGHKILVHGGGKLATELSSKLNIETKMIDGRRVTDAKTLRVTTMVYAGWINKSIVAKLQSLHCRALGLCGADGFCLPAKKRPVGEVDYGFVGDVFPNQINTDFFQNILEFGITPVIAPITCDSKGQLLNTNADTVASSLAEALSDLYETHLIFCFDKHGVLLDKNNSNSVIEKIDTFKYQILRSEKIIADGMIPKLDSAFKAKEAGASSVAIGHASNLLNIIKKQANAGTYIGN